MRRAEHTNHAERRKEAVEMREGKEIDRKHGIVFLPCFFANTILYQTTV